MTLYFMHARKNEIQCTLLAYSISWKLLSDFIFLAVLSRVAKMFKFHVVPTPLLEIPLPGEFCVKNALPIHFFINNMFCESATRCLSLSYLCFMHR
jgi:hypothetical protein